jgi:hypothetical protein
LELNKDSVIAPPKLDIKNLVTYFIDLESRLLGTIPFPPSNDGDWHKWFYIGTRMQKNIE